MYAGAVKIAVGKCISMVESIHYVKGISYINGRHVKMLNIHAVYVQATDDVV
jgi:hypothetical protein